jgi:cystathionine beta-lyase/cystathionine gamma-synthase
MTHASLTRQAPEQAGITDNLIRLSAGCEDTKDLLEDLRGALDALSQREAVGAGTNLA